MAPSAVADAVLRSATEDFYPDSDDVASTDLTTPHRHLPTIVASLQAAQDEVKVRWGTPLYPNILTDECVQEEIRTISREHAVEVDSWIIQARQLHADIEASKTQADKILRLDAEERALAQDLNDAQTKQRFLIDEIRFNESLASMLGKLQLIGTTLTQIEDTIERGELDQAVSILSSAEDALGRLQGFDEIIVVGLMKEKAKMLRKTLLERVEAAWSALVRIEKDNGLVTIRKSVEGMALVESPEAKRNWDTSKTSHKTFLGILALAILAIWYKRLEGRFAGPVCFLLVHNFEVNRFVPDR
jgi:centromere/kinetochore protein ZW10